MSKRTGQFSKQLLFNFPFGCLKLTVKARFCVLIKIVLDRVTKYRIILQKLSY